MGSDWDEPRLGGKPDHRVGEDLSPLSAHELRARVALLREEIGRLEAELARKDTSRAAAEGVFTKGGGN